MTAPIPPPSMLLTTNVGGAVHSLMNYFAPLDSSDDESGFEQDVGVLYAVLLIPLVALVLLPIVVDLPLLCFMLYNHQL